MAEQKWQMYKMDLTSHFCALRFPLNEPKSKQKALEHQEDNKQTNKQIDWKPLYDATLPACDCFY